MLCYSPPKIRTIKILDNPFDDIVPRITAAEKRAQQLAREQSNREREEAARKKNFKKFVCIHSMLCVSSLTRDIRNTKLLSFGQDADVEEENITIKKKNVVRPDLIQPDTVPVTVPDLFPKVEPPPKPEINRGTSQPKVFIEASLDHSADTDRFQAGDEEIRSSKTREKKKKKGQMSER